MFTALAEDVQAFALHYSSDIEFIRLAVTAEQIDLYDLPTSPPKDNNKLSFDDDRTTQAEALDPRVLTGIVRSAIESRLDGDLFQSALEFEQMEREGLVERLDIIA